MAVGADGTSVLGDRSHNRIVDGRVDEEGPAALVQLPMPANRFLDLVRFRPVTHVVDGKTPGEVHLREAPDAKGSFRDGHTGLSVVAAK